MDKEIHCVLLNNMSTPQKTPEQIAADHEVKVLAAAARRMKKKANTERKVFLQNKHNLKFWHGDRMTVAYSPVVRDVLTISTALCAPGDVFSKSEGSYYAASHYDERRVVQLKKPSHVPSHVFLESTFGGRHSPSLLAALIG